MPQWTNDQKRAIETTDRSVLVSAAAGSGKTAVLAERCAHLVVDAKDPCSIDELLVVTFTEAAAAEMRERIARALRDRQARKPGNARIRRQLARLDSAQISTIHAFCRHLLNRYFTFVDLEPRMPMLDPLEASQLRKQCAKEVFDELTAENHPNSEQFLDFVTAYGAHESTLRDRILSIAAFLESHDQPDAWLQQVRDRYSHSDAAELPPQWREDLVQSLTTHLDMLASTADSLRQRCPDHDVAHWFAHIFNAVRQFAEDALDRLKHNPDDRTIDAICGNDINWTNELKVRTRGSKEYKALDESGKSAYADCAEIKDDLKKAIDKFNDRVAGYTCADWAAGIAATAPHVEMLLTAVERTRESYRDAKRDLGVLDFSDLERFTLDLLRDESHHVADRLHHRFRHVLVDEFQDINPIQAEILRLVSTEAAESRPNNLFTVGDVKQSIYRFRLGEPELFIARQVRFNAARQTDGAIIPLSMNFRSETPVIDAINAIFERLMSRELGGIDYVDAARLVPHEASSNPKRETPCEIHVLEDPAKANSDDFIPPGQNPSHFHPNFPFDYKK